MQVLSSVAAFFAPHYRLLLSASGGIRRAVLLRFGKSRCRCQKIIASRQLASPNLTVFPQYAAQLRLPAQVAFGNTDGKTGVANIAGIIGAIRKCSCVAGAIWRVCSATTKKCRFFAVRAAPLPETRLAASLLKPKVQTESFLRAANLCIMPPRKDGHTRAKAMFAFAAGCWTVDMCVSSVRVFYTKAGGNCKYCKYCKYPWRISQTPAIKNVVK